MVMKRIRLRSNPALWATKGKISKMVSDQARKPKTLRTTPGEMRRNTKISSMAVIKWLANSTKVNGQMPPAVKQTTRPRAPTKMQVVAASHLGVLLSAIPQKNPAMSDRKHSAGKIRNRGP